MVTKKKSINEIVIRYIPGNTVRLRREPVEAVFTLRLRSRVKGYYCELYPLLHGERSRTIMVSLSTALKACPEPVEGINSVEP